MSLGHARRLIACIAISLLLCLITACPRSLVSTPVGLTAAQADPGTLHGFVDFDDRRQVQASLESVAKGATVALIRVSNGETVATTLTDARGGFSMRITNGYKPINNELYYIEALKGLSLGDGSANAVGGSLARVRTIALYKDNNWSTLAGTTGAVILNQTTTAIAIVVSLRSVPGFGPAIDPMQLLSTVTLSQPQGGYPDTITLPEAFTMGAHPILPLSLIQRTIDLVADALSKNRDPLRWIALASSDPDHNTVALPDAPFAIAGLSPNSAAPGDSIVLVGSNFGDTPEANQVTFTAPSGATVSATVAAVSPDMSQLTLVVPPTAVTGPLTLTLKGKTLPGPMFNLAVRSGHGTVDVSGNVYIANKGMGTVSITQTIPGSTRLGVKALVSNLDNPSALTFGKSGYPELYVACGGTTKKIFKIDVSGPTPTAVASSSVAPFASPSGIAYQFSSGDYFIADASQNLLYKMAAGGPTPAVTAFPVSGVTLSQPRGLSFGPDGKLYVANTGANNVLAIDVTTGAGSEFLSGLASPYGVAFDNLGSFYVSNNSGNSVYTKPVVSAPGVTPKVYGSLTAFASIPTPGAITADSSGYLYVADTVSNGIYRINQNAESYQVAYGLSYPNAVWSDASGHYIMTDAGRILYYDPVKQILSVFAEGLYSAKGLVRDGDGNFYTNQSSIASLVKIAPNGTTSQLLSGLTSCTNSGVRLNGRKLYLRSSVSVESAQYTSQGEVLEYDLDNLGSTPNARYKSHAKTTVAIARDESGGVYNNYYYGVQTGDASPSIVRINRLATQYAEYTLVTRDTSGRLKDPRDIWVDPNGRIWVADFQGQSGSGGLYVYNADGTPYADYSSSVVKPTNLTSDGTLVYVNNYQTAGDVRALDRNTGAVVRILTGYKNPRGIAFNTGTHTMYVDEGGNKRILAVATYDSAPGASPSFYAANGNYNDIETVGTTIVFTNGGLISRIAADGQTVTNLKTHYDSQLRIFKNSDGKYVWTDGWGNLHHSDMGDYTTWGGPLRTENGRGVFGVRGDSTKSGSSVFTFGRASWTALITEMAADGSYTRTCYWATGPDDTKEYNSVADDGAGTLFLGIATNGLVVKYSNGTFTTLGSAPSSSGPDTATGLTYYNGQVYQVLRTLHRLDQIDPTTGTRTSLKIGLMAPEL